MVRYRILCLKSMFHNPASRISDMQIIYAVEDVHTAKVVAQFTDEQKAEEYLERLEELHQMQTTPEREAS